MKINKTNNSTNFCSIYNNKAILKSLEKVSQHGSSFVAGASCFGAVVLRPLAYCFAPNVEKENKKLLSIDSVSSALTKLAIAEALILPIEKSIKNIEDNPQKFLKKETIENLAEKDFKFLTQTYKMGANLVSSIPKSMLSIALVPVLMDLLLKKKEENKPKTVLSKEYLSKENNSNFSSFLNATAKQNFTGKFSLSDLLAKTIDNENIQKFAKKHSVNDKNIARNMTILTDTTLCLSSIIATKNSKKIKNEQKNPLIINKILSTIMSIGAGYTIDEIMQSTGKSFIKKFSEANKNNPKLSKYLEGINIARPTIIFALLYYGIIPIISSLCTDKLNKNSSQSIR